MLGGGDPVGVDRLDVPRVGLAAPADQEALGDRGGLVHLGLRDRRPAHAARRLRHERQRHHRDAGEVLARLLVGDVDQLAEPPLRARASRARPGGPRAGRRCARPAGAARPAAARARTGRRPAGPRPSRTGRCRRAPRCPPRDSEARRPPCRARRSTYRTRLLPRDPTEPRSAPWPAEYLRASWSALATAEDAADVARLMIGFRDWWQRDEPDDARLRGAACAACSPTRTPSSCSAATPPAGVCQLRYRFAVWTGSDDCCARGPLRRGGRRAARAWAGARRGRPRACARARLRAHGAGRERGEPGRAGALRVARLRELVRPARGPEPAHAAASVTSSTSSPTAMRPGCTMSARRPARCTIPLSTPG